MSTGIRFVNPGEFQPIVLDYYEPCPCDDCPAGQQSECAGTDGADVLVCPAYLYYEMPDSDRHKARRRGYPLDDREPDTPERVSSRIKVRAQARRYGR